MKCVFTYLKMEQSENVDDHAQILINKIEKYLDLPMQAHFTFSKEKFNHKVCLTLKGKNMYFKSESKDENFYAAIEGAVDKMHRQLEKKKSKVKGHKQKHAAKELHNIFHMEDYREVMALRRKLG